MKLVRLVPFALVACGAFTPSSGTWESRNIELVTDACAQFPDDPTERPAAVFELTADASEPRFEIAAGVECEFEDDRSFRCPDDEIQRVALNQDGFDALVVLVQTVGGRFVDEENALVDFDLNVTCQGPDCDDINGPGDPFSAFDVPCSSELDVEWSRLPI